MLGVIGVNHVSARLEVREEVGQALLALVQEIPCLASLPHVALHTCSRTEWYFSSPRPVDVHIELIALLRKRLGDSLLHTFYNYFGVNCFIHLSRVVTGLDSAFLGETEIQGQIKLAYYEAMAHQELHSDLHYLFQKALHIGKTIRKAMPQASVAPFQIEAKIIERMRSIPTLTPASSILLLGASLINQRICNALKYDAKYTKITIANRTHSRAKEFSERFSIPSLPLDKALATWHHFDCIISAVKAAEAILTAPPSYSLEKRPSLIIDLGVPRNIDPDLVQHVHRLDNIETLFPAIHPERISLVRLSSMRAREMAIEYYKRLVARSNKRRQFGASHPYIEEQELSVV